MSNRLETWINGRMPQPGVVGWAARLADRSLTSHSYGDWLSREQLEQTLTRLAHAAERMNQHGLNPVRLCWRFEHARVHLARRVDGVCLALIVENRPGAGGPAIGQMLEDFATLDVAGSL